MALLVSAERRTLRYLAHLQSPNPSSSSNGGPTGEKGNSGASGSASAGGGGGGGGITTESKERGAATGSTFSLNNLHQHTPASPSIELVEEDIRLEGFQLYLRPDWLSDRERLFKTYAVVTDDNENVVLASVAKFGASTMANPSGKDASVSHGYDLRIRKAFGKFDADGLRPLQTRHGILMVLKQQAGSKDGSGKRTGSMEAGNATGVGSPTHGGMSTALLVPDGNYDAHVDRIKLILNLVRLGAGDRFSGDLGPQQRLRRRSFT
ncbi:hypothetical protein BC829DRAFT_92629 [Chytridium lagenaria]|nr:hypothetical protein BC829DRAFT_92629 [Chytridium lagenaria]